ARPGEGLRVDSRRAGNDATALLLVRERGELGEHAPGLEGPRLLEELGLEKGKTAESAPERRRGEERRPVETAGDDGRCGFYIRVYSEPAPPSGGVSRPPFAVIAPD